MAVRISGNDFTVTGTRASLSSLLGLTEKRHFSVLTLRADPSNTGIVYGGDGTVTVAANRQFFLQPGEAISFDLKSAWTDTDQVYLIASSPGDRIFEVDLS